MSSHVFEGPLELPEQTAPATPASGRAVLYWKQDGKLYWKDDAGVESGVVNTTIGAGVTNLNIADGAVAFYASDTHASLGLYSGSVGGVFLASNNGESYIDITTEGNPATYDDSAIRLHTPDGNNALNLYGSGKIELIEQTTPSMLPAANHSFVYVGTDGALHVKNDAGTDKTVVGYTPDSGWATGGLTYTESAAGHRELSLFTTPDTGSLLIAAYGAVDPAAYILVYSKLGGTYRPLEVKLSATGSTSGSQTYFAVTETGHILLRELAAPGAIVGSQAMLYAGTDGALHYKNDSNVDIALGAGYTDEQVRDVVGAALVAGNNIDITVNDVGDTITIDVEALTSADISDFAEATRDTMGTALVAGANVTITPDDNANTITIAATGGGSFTEVNWSTIARFVSKNGSDANDGLTWNRPKLTVRAALESLPTATHAASGHVFHYGTIYVAPGEYLETVGTEYPNYVLDVTGALRIIGGGLGPTGRDTRITLANNQNKPLVGSVATLGSDMHGCYFENISFNGNKANQTTSTGADADLFRSEGSGFGYVFRNCGFGSAKRYGFYLNGNACNLYFDGVDFVECGDATQGGAVWWEVSGSPSQWTWIYSQIDRCGVYPIQINVSSVTGDGTLAHWSGLKFENNGADTALHQQCIRVYPRSADSGGGVATFLFESIYGNTPPAAADAHAAMIHETNATGVASRFKLINCLAGGAEYTKCFTSAKTGQSSIGRHVIDGTFSGEETFGFAPGRNTPLIERKGVGSYVGTGSPEGVITAPVGSEYRRIDGGTGTTLYTKESGTGNTGWAAIAAGGGYTDEQVRDVMGTALVAGSNVTITPDDVGDTITIAATVGGAAPYAATVGDGSATSYVVTHSLGTRDVAVELYDIASPYTTVNARVERTSTNTVTVVFATPPATNSVRVLVFSQGSTGSFTPLNLSVNAQTGTTYTPVLGDNSQLVTLSNAGAITVTMPQDSAVAIPVGGQVHFTQLGAGQVTFAAGTGATLNSTPTAKTRAQYSTVTAIKRAANTWLLVGDLAAS